MLLTVYNIQKYPCKVSKSIPYPMYKLDHKGVDNTANVIHKKIDVKKKVDL